MQPFNKYYPPDYDGKSNINKMAGTHALGRRARKLDQGILVVRFEMPFNIWCEKCNNHIGQGVRFNAEKKRVGNYYSTPIWSFRMKCHLCNNGMEIKTDPENTRYVIVEGAKKQTDEWDTTDQGVVQPKDVQEKEKLEDPFARLEKEEQDKVKASEQHQTISKLYDLSHRQWSDPWTRNQQLRKTFREEKNVLKAKKALTEQIRDRNALHIELLPEAEDDTTKARLIEYEGKGEKEASLRQREFRTGSIVLGKRDHCGDSKRHELERMVRLNTRERSDPFLNMTPKKTEPPSLNGKVKIVKKRNVSEHGNGVALGLVNGYSSGSE